MLTEEGCRARRERLWEGSKEAPDYVILGAPRHLTYFAGYYPSPFSFASQNAPALLILHSDGTTKLVVDGIQMRLTESAHVDEIAVADWYNGRDSAAARSDAIAAAVLRILSKLTPGTRWIDSGVPFGLSERLRMSGRGSKIVQVDQLILDLSRSKDPDELQAIRRSISAMEAGYRAARNGIRPGITEMEAYTLVEQAATESAGHQVVLYGDFASGPRTESGGGQPTGRVIEKGDLFLLDFSVVIQGYRGDLCSTFMIDGKPSDRQRQMVECCLEAMGEGEGKLRAGAACRDVDSAVRSVFHKRGLGEYFKHHSGHGIGLGHPDPPYIVPESSETLLAGDVVTLEPGCYIPGVGGMRFEHNYLITDSDFERLSNHDLGLE